jgi:hemolysin III
VQRPHDDAELAADRVIHVIGVGGGIVGAILLVALGWRSADRTAFIAIILYSISLVAMLGCSAAYNLAPPSPRREVLRRLDHAAIFVMIAGTYSPFTLGRLDGAWSVWLAGGVWTVALLGAAAKIAFPRRFGRIAVAAYLGLGWAALLAIDPLLAALDPATVALLATGGVVYSAGVGFHLWHGLRYHKPIWHGCVLFAATCHYLAVVLII